MAKLIDKKKRSYQIQISLRGSKPKIWRRVLIPSDLCLYKLHLILQITMGWDNSHLHQFMKNSSVYLDKFGYGDIWYEDQGIDYDDVVVSDLLKKVDDKIVYLYDFGDGWTHDIVLEKIEDAGFKAIAPVCLKGKNDSPPDDCGGIWGYYHMLEVLKNPDEYDEEEYEYYSQWLGEDYDPGYFDIDKVNELLQERV